jgi:hypothetical protein
LLRAATLKSSSRYRNSYWPGSVGALSVNVPEVAASVDLVQTCGMVGPPTLESEIESSAYGSEVVQLTLNCPPEGTTFVLAVTVYAPDGDGATGTGVTGVGVGAAGEVPPQARVMPRSTIRVPSASIDRTPLFRSLFNIEFPSVSRSEKQLRKRQRVIIAARTEIIESD